MTEDILFKEACGNIAQAVGRSILHMNLPRSATLKFADCIRPRKGSVSGGVTCSGNGKNLLFYKDEITKWIESNKTNGHLVSIPTVDEYMNSRINR